MFRGGGEQSTVLLDDRGTNKALPVPPLLQTVRLSHRLQEGGGTYLRHPTLTQGTRQRRPYPLYISQGRGGEEHTFWP